MASDPTTLQMLSSSDLSQRYHEAKPYPNGGEGGTEAQGNIIGKKERECGNQKMNFVICSEFCHEMERCKSETEIGVVCSFLIFMRNSVCLFSTEKNYANSFSGDKTKALSEKTKSFDNLQPPWSDAAEPKVKKARQKRENLLKKIFTKK